MVLINIANIIKLLGTLYLTWDARQHSYMSSSHREEHQHASAQLGLRGAEVRPQRPADGHERLPEFVLVGGRVAVRVRRVEGETGRAFANKGKS